MPLKSYKPTSPGVRGAVRPTFEEITRKKPEKSLLRPHKKWAGRNNQGRVTVRHRGGGVKRKYRVIDFKRDKPGVPGRVIAIQYDPNRSARIALVQYADGEKRYVLASQEMRVGTRLLSGEEAEVREGNTRPLMSIPLGTQVHNIELEPGRGGQLARSAGAVAQVLARTDDYVQVRLPSGEVRRILGTCMATIGQVGNVDHKNTKLGKAGRSRLMGLRPEVRGVAMSPRDHPHGGGEGRSGIGMSSPKSPWGKPTLGYRTRRNTRTDNMRIRRREK